MGPFNRLTIVLFLLSSVAALGQVAHDVSSAAQSLNGGTSASWSHTASGSNRYARVGFGASGGSAPTASSITYGGSAMTSVAVRSDAGLAATAAIYGFIAPATTSQTISITFDTNAYGAAGSSSYTGVHQTTPSGAAFTNTASGAAQSVSVTVTDAVTGDMVSDVMKHYESLGLNPTVGAGQTQRWLGDDGSFNENAGASDEAGAASVTMSWTGTSAQTQQWVIAAAAIKQAGGAPARRRNAVIASR
jgi:hypothetical protein